MNENIKNTDIEVDSSKIKNKDIYIKPNKWQTITLILTFIIFGGLNFLLSNSIVLAIQGSLFATLLTYVSFVDLKMKLVSDYSVLALFAIGLITIIPNLLTEHYSYCLYNLLAAIIVPIPLFIGALVSSGGIGGGDVKLISAIAFTLGINKGVYALIVGLLLAVIIQLVIVNIKKLDKKTTSFALVPYLAIGSIIFYVI